MPRNYQTTKNNPYWLPHNVYMRVLYIVRDYPRMKAEQNDVIYTSPKLSENQYEHDGSKNRGVSGGQHGDPTANKAVKIAMMSRETDAVDYAVQKLPEAYRAAIWENILHGKPYKIPADKDTFRRWRSRFCYYVAERLHYV